MRSPRIDPQGELPHDPQICHNTPNPPQDSAHARQSPPLEANNHRAPLPIQRALSHHWRHRISGVELRTMKKEH